MADRLNDILGQIREHGGRVTVPRRAIIRALLDHDDHLTAEKLSEIVQARHPDVHLSTVYRCLETLSDLDVIDHVHFGHGPAVYHLTDHAHRHVVCESCQAVFEIPDGALDRLAERLDDELGFQLDSRHFALGGHCRSCRQRR